MPLDKRIIDSGTLSEPDGKADARFTLPSTLNWLRALNLLVADRKFSFEIAQEFYHLHAPRKMSVQTENTVFEQLFLGLHHLSALERMKSEASAADYARIGILALCAGILNAAGAMTAAFNDSFQEDHSNTATQWDMDLSAHGLIMDPFSWRVSNLVERAYKLEVEGYKGNSTGDLQNTPYTVDDAIGVSAGYLSGTAKWYAWLETEKLRNTPAFKELGVSDFRTKLARELRDSHLQSKAIGFVHQIERYGGKANYRDAIFLAYGKSLSVALKDFVADQASILRAFLVMAGGFSSKYLGQNLWSEFVSDVDGNRAFTISASSVWR